MILVFGILGLIVCFPFGIVAWVMGNTDLKAMDAGTMDPGGRGTTQAGKIIGIVTTILTVLSIIIGIFFFAVALIMAAVVSSSSLLI
jgi:hypothetical protein